MLHLLFCHGRPTSAFLFTRTLSLETAYHLWMELSDGGSFPNLVRNCRWTFITDRRSWNVSTQNAFSLLFATILVNCAPSGEMHNYCTPLIIKENFENFLIHWCNNILLSQVYCIWQVVKIQTIIWNNPVLSHHFAFELNEHFGNWSSTSDLLSTQFGNQAFCHIVFLKNSLLQVQKCSVGHDYMFVSVHGWTLSLEVQTFMCNSMRNVYINRTLIIWLTRHPELCWHISY